MNPEVPERNIYSELPNPVADFSRKLETLVADLLDEKEKSLGTSALTLPFRNQDPTTLTRAGGPPVILPQNEKYHQFDTLTHLDIAAYYAKEYKAYLLPLLTPHSAAEVLSILRDVDITPFVVSAQLHDIEKVFWVSAVDNEHPWEKASTKAKLNLLDLDESEDLCKPQLQRHFLLGDNEFSTGHSTFDALAGYFKNAGIDADRSLGILGIYSAIDQSFIETGNEQIDDKSFTENFLRVSKDKELSVVVLGILTMICDNLAQGNPPGKDDEFESKVAENIRRCQLLLDAVLSEQ